MFLCTSFPPGLSAQIPRIATHRKLPVPMNYRATQAFARCSFAENLSVFAAFEAQPYSHLTRGNSCEGVFFGGYFGDFGALRPRSRLTIVIQRILDHSEH